MAWMSLLFYKLKWAVYPKTHKYILCLLFIHLDLKNSTAVSLCKNHDRFTQDDQLYHCTGGNLHLLMDERLLLPKACNLNINAIILGWSVMPSSSEWSGWWVWFTRKNIVPTQNCSQHSLWIIMSNWVMIFATQTDIILSKGFLVLWSP